jgi:uncharacterized protein (DUF302 family)
MDGSLGGRGWPEMADGRRVATPDPIISGAPDLATARFGIEWRKCRREEEHPMEELDYTVASSRTFDQAVEAVLEGAKKQGFGVLHVHDVQATLAAKGLVRGPLKIIEVCHAKHAFDVLAKDPKISLMLPCPISVYVEGGATTVCALKPKLMGSFYPKAGIAATAEAVDGAVRAIVDAAR